MRVHLVNPSDVSFGVAVITPRWLFVLAAATPARFGDPVIVDETLERFDPERIAAGDVVGIGIHTGNALRGYEVGRAARDRGAFVVFGGIHATLYPDEPLELGGAHAVARGDGDHIWGEVLADCEAGTVSPATKAAASRAPRSSRRAGICCRPANTCGRRCRRCAAVPKHCSFCSVWRTDGQAPRMRGDRRGGQRDRRAAPPRASASSRSPTTTSIRCRSRISRWRRAARIRRGCTSSKRCAPSASS